MQKLLQWVQERQGLQEPPTESEALAGKRPPYSAEQPT